MKKFGFMKSQDLALLLIVAVAPLLVFVSFYIKRSAQIRQLLFVLPACLMIGVIFLALCLIHHQRLKQNERQSKLDVSFYLSSLLIIALSIFLSVKSLSGAASLRPGSALDIIIFLLMPVYLIPTAIIGYLMGWAIELLLYKKTLPITPGCKNRKSLIVPFVVIISLLTLYLINFGLKYFDFIPAPNIYYATQKGNTRQVNRFLKKGIDINQEDDTIYKKTPLHVAAVYGKSDMISFLCSQGANINSRNATLQTPLHLAARIGHLTASKTLVSLGAIVDSRDQSGYTPLRETIRRGHDDIALFLIKKGANVNLKDRSGQTPIFMAVYYNYPEIVKMLLKHGAEIDIQDTKGRTLLSIAKEKQFHEIKKILMEEK